MKNSTWGWRRRIARAAGAFAGVLLAAAAHAQETAPAAPRILALGDSLVAGFGLAAPDGFVAQLERALRAAGRDVTVLDGAVSGDTTAGGRARLAWALGDGVDGVIVELGANDALRGIDPASSRANLDAILARLADAGVPVLLAGMYAPRNLGAAYVAAFDGMYPELAARHGALLYPFFLDGVAGEPALNQDDGIHPNARGVAVVVERILPFVVALLDRVEAAR